MAQKVRLALLVATNEPAGGGDHVGPEDVIAGQPTPAGEMAYAATQGEAGDAGGGDDPAGRRHAEGRGGVIGSASMEMARGFAGQVGGGLAGPVASAARRSQNQ
jgi:hypothetical protein